MEKLTALCGLRLFGLGAKEDYSGDDKEQMKLYRKAFDYYKESE